MKTLSKLFILALCLLLFYNCNRELPQPTPGVHTKEPVPTENGTTGSSGEDPKQQPEEVVETEENTSGVVPEQNSELLSGSCGSGETPANSYLFGNRYLVTCNVSRPVHDSISNSYFHVTEVLFTDTLTVHPGGSHDFLFTIRDDAFFVNRSSDCSVFNYRINGTLTLEHFYLNIGTGGEMGGSLYYTGTRIY